MALGASSLEKEKRPTPPSCSTGIPAATAARPETESKNPTEYEHFMDDIHDLAKEITTESHSTPGGPFSASTEGPLNPNSPAFDARKWTKAFLGIRKDALGSSSPKTIGVAFKDLDVYGYGAATNFQKNVANVFLQADTFARKMISQTQHRVDILRGLEGVVHSGEMVAVLGPPGSGCSTFLKTIAGDTHGFHVADEAAINYQGIHPNEMQSAFRGEAIYTAEVDHHFSQMTVGDTLYFAARARCPKNVPDGVSQHTYAEHLRDVLMAMFGISHTKNTRVGDDFIRGVSGGERKRVTIAEASLSYSPLQCWDNSTRGLDSANAIGFCRTLRTQADFMGCTSFVAIYQAPQDAYNAFDKVILLYQGRQIFFGRSSEAKAYFEELGFVCPEQQTTADFLTSMTSPQERIVRSGCEHRVPRSPDEFAEVWKQSSQRKRLMEDVDVYFQAHPFNGEDYDRFLQLRRMDQSRLQRKKSPFTLSYMGQLCLNMWRGFVMLKTDPSLTITMLVTNFCQALIISSIFYNQPDTTDSFDKRGLLIFFIVIMNALGSIMEIMTLYAKRKIVEKHNRYAFYHSSSEALASMIVDLPYKIVNAILINTVLYFMTNLRREAGAYFFFLLINFTTTLAMSMMFRLIGSMTKSIAQALAPAAIILLGLVLYTGYAIPPAYMLDWIGWSRWANPVYYTLEAAMINEFNGRDFACSTFVPDGPSYDSVPPMTRTCSQQGAVPGQDYVSGTTYLDVAYGYDPSHRWRNFGILIAFAIGYMVLHLVATEFITSERSKGEVLLFSRKVVSKHKCPPQHDIENIETAVNVRDDAISKDGEITVVKKQTSTFHWRNLCYDIKIKSEPRRILDNVDGWTKPGTLTALMGASGAGKTTLLDVLASRVTMGVVTGEMLVNGQACDDSFQRKTGYAQQQDLHLHTATVREALNFSALLRQPPRYTRQEKLDYVDTVISLLNMEEYSEAFIGVPGEGLNVEQRKRLTIGVELAARPELLLFLDEPTSGLDSQTSWSICDLMEKLTKNGQAILCTIHQPSAMLFQRFDRLLLLSKGRTIYFGDVGKDSHILVDYFTRNGASPRPPGANPAEYMLEVICAAPGAHTEIDWPEVWKRSPEYREVQTELDILMTLSSTTTETQENDDPSSYQEFAASSKDQFMEVVKRVFQQYWRFPSYIYSKALLGVGSTLFIGLSFIDAQNTQRGLRNQMFGVFIFLSIFPQLVDQILPVFVSQRTMYEARERPSKAYSWKAFMIANILVELFWNSLTGLICFITWYFPMGLYRNAEWTDQVHSRAITMCLHVWMFFLFTSTFANMVIAGIESADVAGGIVNLIMILMFAFCGVLAGPTELPGFWIFMYRVNPFTYVVEGFLGTSLANAPVQCSPDEFVTFSAPNSSTCRTYLSDYLSRAGGYLEDPDSTECRYCALSETNGFLSSINVSWDNRWRDFGFMWVYCIFNIVAAVFLYWLVRVPKRKSGKSS